MRTMRSVVAETSGAPSEVLRLQDLTARMPTSNLDRQTLPETHDAVQTHPVFCPLGTILGFNPRRGDASVQMRRSML